MNHNFIEKIAQLEKIIIELKQMNIHPQKEINTKYLKKNTINFINDMKNKYKFHTINRNDRYVKESIYKNRITDLAQILNRLESQEVIYVQRSANNRIETFKFLNQIHNGTETEIR